MKKPILILLIALTFVLTLAPTLSAAGYTKNVAIVVYNGVEILDFTGPAEVFAASSGRGANGSERAFNVYLVSKTREPIVSQGFIDVIPDYSIADSPKPDIIVLPGGGADGVINDPEWLAWVKTSAEGADHILTVCTGAFIAGKLGLLDGHDVTTWYAAVPELTRQFPKARVQPGRRFIDNGKVITTAGVSAGIDGALHLVARTLGRYVADRTAEYMEYAWTPPSYTASTYAQLNPRLDEHGRKFQQASITAREGDQEGAIAIYRSLIAANAKDAEAWLQLGRTLHELKRYPEAVTAFTEAAKGEPQRATALYNLACAYALSGEREKAIDAATKSVDAGFRTKYYYQSDEDLASVREDPRFKALLAKL
ncbi:MAG TPA: DJ-1/PfpI family protein [Thermoanaerobaculia bacterium]|nr:DJ-1/PfpI family protein [Thermoanaerobaculia bacterium]